MAKQDVYCTTIQKEDVSLCSTKISNGWWQRFLEQNPRIRLQSGDLTAVIWLDAVNPEKLNNYFDLLKQIFDEFGFEDCLEAIYNMEYCQNPTSKSCCN